MSVVCPGRWSVNVLPNVAKRSASPNCETIPPAIAGLYFARLRSLGAVLVYRGAASRFALSALTVAMTALPSASDVALALVSSARAVARAVVPLASSYL